MAFYGRLLAVLRRPAVQDGDWRLLEVAPAWEGNGSSAGFIACTWRGHDGQRLLVAVNLSPDRGQCYVHLPFEELAGQIVRLRDALGDAVFDRSGDDLLAGGLYLDVPGWGHHAFDVDRID